MPFRNRRFKKKQSAGKLALRKVNNLMNNIEKKRLEQDVSTTSTTTALISALNLVAVGDTGITRTGNVITLENVLLNYSIRMNTSDDFVNMRVMIVQDNQVDGAIFAIGDLLSFTSSEKAITSPYNLDGALRFKVLYDRQHSFNQGARPNGTFKVWKKLGGAKGLKIRYNGTSATIGGVLNKGIFLVHISDEATNSPVITYQTRVRFTDA